MFVTQVAQHAEKQVIITPVEIDDFKKISKKRYFFDWKKAAKTCSVFKLSLVEDDDILGLVGLIDFPEECRIQIALICVSRENKGATRKFKGITGCLIAFACKRAVKKYTDDACVSMIPKTGIRNHYIEKYNMLDGRRQLFLEGVSLRNLIIKYDI